MAKFRIPEQLNIADWFLCARLREGLADKTAVITSDAEYTYADVDVLSNRFANHLAARGIRAGERVIIALPDGIDFVGAFFGVIKHGAVVVMVNPYLEREHFDYFVEYTGASGVIYNHVISPALGHAATQAAHSIQCLTNMTDVHSAASGYLPANSHRDDPAVWLFSGGTTGKPKAVVQTHRSFVNTTQHYAHGAMGYTSSDITMSIPKLFFGYATGSNLLFPFSVGATTVLFEDRPTPEVLFEQIKRHQPTLLINVPTMINRMVAHPEASQQDFSSIRATTSAGEALPVELHTRWNTVFGGELFDGLGTAEMWHIFVSNQPGDVRPGTLGRVIPGFEISVRDDDGSPLPDGEVGTMWVRGDSLGLGYWQNQDKSREAFYGPWYRSQDLICRDTDGYITYCGRSGDMFKVAGRWVASKEIENCLLQHNDVKEAAVVGMTDPSSGLTKPHAFVIVHTPQTGLPEALKQHVLESLEAYKTPRHITVMDSFPRTHLGKVDRGKLRAL